MDKKEKKKQRQYGKRLIWPLLIVFALLYIGVILWHTYKPLPEGIPYEGALHKTDTVELFTDVTYAQDKKGTDMRHELTIFDEVYKMIGEAKQFIVLDFFLMDHYYDEDEDFPEIAQNLTSVLVKKKEQNPDMRIVFITDPLNTGYGSYNSIWFDQLEEAGIEVIYTDLMPLRDSTPIYSGVYRTIFQWEKFEKKGWIPNAMSAQAPDMKLSSYMALMNVKANHRKTVATDQAALVTSGNPHNASGFHGNAALKVTNPGVINDLLASEEAVLHYMDLGDLPRVKETAEDGQYEVQVVTERKIMDAMLEDIQQTEKGDRIRTAMFFIAEREIVEELTAAAKRGVQVEMILDPNENSFGNEKSGLPNRPVVQEMMEKSEGNMEIRWYNTVVGQFHTKLFIVEKGDDVFISNGSANLTERTLDNYNLETNLRVVAPKSSDLPVELDAYFERLWNNEDALYTLDLDEYQSEFTFLQRGIYSLQTRLKLTTY